MKYFIFLLILTAFAMPANAQQNVCGKRDDIVTRLENGYQEFNTAMGMSSNGRLVELFTSEKGSWTLMLTTTDGVSCLIAAGENWETFEPKVNLGDSY